MKIDHYRIWPSRTKIVSEDVDVERIETANNSSLKTVQVPELRTFSSAVQRSCPRYWWLWFLSTTFDARNKL
jgi:hypothetical protein